jgi:hypothetical protein
MTDEEQLADLFAQLGDIEEPTDVENFAWGRENLAKGSSELLADTLRLRALLSHTDKELSSLRQLLGDPTTPKARELHSRRSGLVIELKLRGAL